MKLEPTKPEPSKAVMQQLSAEEIATLVRRADDFLKMGDISAARLALRRAANSGHAPAALVLGMTYDPQFLAEQGVIGFAPEPAQARTWYERAVALGSTEAARRLERLAVTARP
jgi:TPR repeat protein